MAATEVQSQGSERGGGGAARMCVPGTRGESGRGLALGRWRQSPLCLLPGHVDRGRTRAVSLCSPPPVSL